MAEPANRHDLPGGGKYYRHPVTDEVFDSVTTVLDSWDKDGLKIWAGMVAAEEAIDVFPLIMAAALVPECGNTFNRCYTKHGRDGQCERCPCGRCTRCLYRRIAWRHEAESRRRAAEGTEIHEAIAHWVVSGGERISMRPEVAPYFDRFLQWTADYGLTPNRPDGSGSWEQVEATAINREHMYAGTTDAVIWLSADRSPKAAEMVYRLRGLEEVHALVRVDWKSREKPEEALYNDMALQGVAYERTTHLLLPNGQEVPTKRTHARMVLQLRPDPPPGYKKKIKANDPGYTFLPMAHGKEDEAFAAFLGLLAAHRWRTQFGDAKAFELQPLPADLAPPEPPAAAQPKKRAPAKKATKSATAAADPFVLAQPGPDLTRAGRDPWPHGEPVAAGFNDGIPF